MRIFDDIRYKMGLRQLSRQGKSHVNRAVACNLNDAANVGIVFDATCKADFVVVEDFVHKLMTDNKQVHALGFVNDKHLDVFHIQPLNFGFFCLKDLNRYYMPVEPSVYQFVNTPFDILIDLDINHNLATRFVVVRSKSRFKTGDYTSEFRPLHDMIIDLSTTDESQKLPILIEQTVRYLRMIKIRH